MASYTFPQDTIVKSIFNDNIINSNVITFKYTDTIKFCVYVDNCYIIGYLTNARHQITTHKITEFEELFPEFPYYKANYERRQMIEMITTTNNRIDKVVSHLEALMIGLGQRKASEDNLDI